MLFLAAPKDPLQTAWCIYDRCVVAFSDRLVLMRRKGWHEWVCRSRSGVGLLEAKARYLIFVAAPPPTEVSFYVFRFSQDCASGVLKSGPASEVVGIMQPLGRSCLACDARLSTGQRYTNALFRLGAFTRTHTHTLTWTYTCLLPVRPHFGFTSRAPYLIFAGSS